MSDELETTFDESENVTINPPSVEAIQDLWSLDEYSGEVVTRWWAPDKQKPEQKLRLDIRIRALKSSDLNIINRRFNAIVRMPSDLEFLQQQLSRCGKPPRELDRLQKKLDGVQDSDFDDDDNPHADSFKSAEDKAETVRIGLEKQINQITDDWKVRRQEITDKIEEINNAPSAYELLRAEFFSKVIHDHSIGLHGRKLDFNHPAQNGDEPSDEFADKLRQYLMEEIGRGKAQRRNGGSAR